MEVGTASGSYNILAKLAEGGMAEIFLARTTTREGIDRLVVVKRILPQLAYEIDLVKMFVHEARLAQQLQHPNVAKVYDIGKLGSSYFFTMEYVQGQTVRSVMLYARGNKKRISIGAVLAIIAGAAAGLHHAHDQRGPDGRPLGIVHADVSPSNLMISQEGEVKLVDFGIAKAADSAMEDTQLRGKISYLSPEQCHASKKLDRRSDLFSLGVVMWELLTLQGLFRRGSDFENMMAIESEPTPPPSDFRPDVPPQVDAIVAGLLAKHPDQRFQTGAQLVQAIEQAAAQMRIGLSNAWLGQLMDEYFPVKEEAWLEMTISNDRQMIVEAEPVPVTFAETIAGNYEAPVDTILRTLRPTVAAQKDLPGDRARDSQPSLEEYRNQMLAQQRMQTPLPARAEGEPDTGGTMPRGSRGPVVRIVGDPALGAPRAQTAPHAQSPHVATSGLVPSSAYVPTPPGGSPIAGGSPPGHGAHPTGSHPPGGAYPPGPGHGAYPGAQGGHGAYPPGTPGYQTPPSGSPIVQSGGYHTPPSGSPIVQGGGYHTPPSGSPIVQSGPRGATPPGSAARVASGTHPVQGAPGTASQRTPAQTPAYGVAQPYYSRPPESEWRKLLLPVIIVAIVAVIAIVGGMMAANMVARKPKGEDAGTGSATTGSATTGSATTGSVTTGSAATGSATTGSATGSNAAAGSSAATGSAGSAAPAPK